MPTLLVGGGAGKLFCVPPVTRKRGFYPPIADTPVVANFPPYPLPYGSVVLYLGVVGKIEVDKGRSRRE